MSPMSGGSRISLLSDRSRCWRHFKLDISGGMCVR